MAWSEQQVMFAEDMPELYGPGPLEGIDPSSMEFYPLTSPGMPVPGEDFITQAVNLGDPKPKVEGVREEKRLVSCGPILTDFYRKALYMPDFTLPVKVKGRMEVASFIPGHLWCGKAGGPRRARVMVVGKWPAQEEMRVLRNFVGASGQILVDNLDYFGLKYEDYGGWYITNLVKHPVLDRASDKAAASHIKNCMVLLEQELRIVRPDYVLCLGPEPYNAVVGKSDGTITQVQGRIFDKQVRLNMDIEEAPVWHSFKVMAIIHPAAVSHSAERLPDFRTGLKGFLELVRGQVAARPKEKLDHRVIWNAQHLGTVVDEILAEDPDPAVAVDCEWHGDYPGEPLKHEPGLAWLRTIQFSHKPGSAFCVPLREAGGMPAFRPNIQEAVPHLQRLFKGKNGKARVIGHNIRADLPWIKLGLDEKFGDFMIRQSDAPPDGEIPPGPNPNYDAVQWGWQRTKREGGFDTMLAAHSVRETDGSYGLDILALQYCGVERYDHDLEKWKQVHCRSRKIGTRTMKVSELEGYGYVPDEILHPYALWDVDATQRLFHKFNNELLDNDPYGNNCRMPFWISMRASLAFLEMEMTGVLIDRERGQKLTEVYTWVRDKLRKELEQLFVWPGFNPQSAQQCKVALFGPQYSGKIDKGSGQVLDIRPIGARSLGLPPIKTSGKPSKSWELIRRKKQEHLFSPCTDKEVLGGLITRYSGNTKENKPALPELEHLITLRNFRFAGQVVKSVLRQPTTNDHGVVDLDENENQIFEEGLLSFIYVDGRVHTHLFQTKETGRASSARPPLQNISKRREKAYKTILKDKYLYPLRTMIRATDGWVLVEADYRGAELYMMAIQSGDEQMIEHCRRANLPDNDPNQYDIHSNICVKAFGLTCHPSKKGLSKAVRNGIEEDLSYLRDVTKTIVFGIPYGRGDAAVVRAVEEEGAQISMEDAAAIRAAVLDTYPRLGPYLEACQARVSEPGWMRNCFGRLRRFQKSRYGNDDGGAEREAGNFPIQSGVADAVSRALDHLYNHPERFDEKGEAKYRMVLQIHDAILFEVRIPYIEWFCGTEHKPGIISQCMTDKVTVWPCDLDGNVLPDPTPYHMGTEVSLCLHWGEKIKREKGLELGIPEIYLPAPEKKAA
jgi:uracil-DNA glycosylase family 4